MHVTIKPFLLPSLIDFDRPTTILPTPDESRILIHKYDGIQVWSLRQFTESRDAPRDDIIGVDLSRDASLLTLATETGIEIWDACIGRRRKVIQNKGRSRYDNSKHVASRPSLYPTALLGLLLWMFGRVN